MIVDIALVICALAAFFSGLRQGGVAALLSLAGVLIGGYLGLQAVGPVVRLVQDEGTEGSRLVIALLTLAGCVVIGYLLGSGIGQRIRDNIRTRRLYQADSAVGSLVAVVTAMVVMWMIAVPVVSSQDSRIAREAQDSRIIATIGEVAPNWMRTLPARINALINRSEIPAVTDPFASVTKREVQPPDPALQDLPDVAAIGPSVVKVEGIAEQCSRMQQGTGFVVEPGVVMTNAHVVAGTNKVTLSTVNGPVDTDVVFYDPEHDIALLRATGELPLQPLRWADKPAVSGDDAIALGYPLGGPFKAAPVRVREQMRIAGPNIYANQRVEREAYSLRGKIVQGNSGGPLVAPNGEVLGLIFGADSNEADTGYALTKKEVLERVGDTARWSSPVDTRSCVAD
ncbi:MarP family serine protease [Corynebacterium urealyticum]|uniref:MarP family serine protease n=1 Tax=Corynebacterium urealyticum TaxID=43771 RepID=UPI0011E71E10|nr:MarP family serine protease [Corynebacterium urealyticum]QQE51236.1 MarP family serine protease [Corynebacterium urealyticum]TYR18752.1 MarP family serine protease [Corynebacterium urealyticum]